MSLNIPDLCGIYDSDAAGGTYWWNQATGGAVCQMDCITDYATSAAQQRPAAS